jgi:hypothetical protein
MDEILSIVTKAEGATVEEVQFVNRWLIGQSEVVDLIGKSP